MCKLINYSIIIPHSDISHLLDRLLSTIPIMDDIQIIVVDDCSVKEEQLKLEYIKDKYPTVEFYSTETKGGGGKARNIGLKYAVGKWVLFADADDYFNLCFYETINMYLNSNADIIYFGCNSVDVDTFRNSHRDISMHTALDRFLITKDEKDIRFKHYVPWSKMYRKSIIDNNHLRFDETKVSNDVWFSTIFDFYAKKLEADPRAIYCVTNRKNSTSKQVDADDRISRLKTELKRYCFLCEKGYKDRVKDDVLDIHLFPVYLSGDRELFQKMISICHDSGINTQKIKRHLKCMAYKIKVFHILSKFHIKII